MMQNMQNKSWKSLNGKWSVQASIHMHGSNEVTLVWGSLMLTPKMLFTIIYHWYDLWE